MARRVPPRQWLLIGVACGIVAVVALRAVVALLLGSLKIMAVVGAVALVWVLVRGPRDGGR